MAKLVHRAQAAVLALVVLEWGLFFSWSGPRPSQDERWEGQYQGERFDNRLGQSGEGWWPWAFGIAFVPVFYGVKLAITRTARRRSTAIVWYCLLVAAALPYIWLLVATDWNNELANDGAYYMGTPLQLLLVPSVSFAFDLAAERRRSMRVLVLRSLAEVLIVVPVWALLVYPVVALCLGFYWI
jgi:hypothetical protein